MKKLQAEPFFCDILLSVDFFKPIIKYMKTIGLANRFHVFGFDLLQRLAIAS